MSAQMPQASAMTEAFAVLKSLEEACNAAGGSGPTIARLQAMTALELLEHIAPNGVRFCYVDQSKKGSKA